MFRFLKGFVDLSTYSGGMDTCHPQQTHEQSRFAWYQFERLRSTFADLPMHPKSPPIECFPYDFPTISSDTLKREDVHFPGKVKMDLQNWWFVKVSSFPICFFGGVTMLHHRQ